MTIVLPKDYEAIDAIQERHIHSITEDQAAREDIRALRVGILNLVSCTEDYEANLLQPLGRSVMQIEPVWLRLKTAKYDGPDTGRINRIYTTFEESVDEEGLDGLILAGASDQKDAFETLPVWPEICRILKYARNNISATMGLSWGAQAVAAFLGMKSEPYDKPFCGVFKAKNLNDTHSVTGAMDDEFECPVCRKSGVPDKVLEQNRNKGAIVLLAEIEKAGYLIAESSDRRFLMHFGHPEFEIDSIPSYCCSEKVRNGGVEPENFNSACSLNTWRSHRNVLFGQWIKYIHETRTY